MSQLRPDPATPGSWIVAGELSFETVPGLLEDSAMFGGDGGHLRLDLRDVTRADSAGLALLIEWLKTARRGGRQIEFANVPPQLLAVARASGIDRILPIAPLPEGEERPD